MPPAQALLAAAVHGDLEVGPVEVEGGQVPDAPAVAEQLTNELRGCQGAGAPATRSELTVKAKIGPNGEVRFAKPTGGEDLDGTVVACMTGKVARAQFAPPRGNDPTVVIPIAVSYY